MSHMTGGQALVEGLIANGVDTVFGIISVHTLDLYDALRSAELAGRLRFMGARNEQALGYMADGYARVTGRPGVMVTSSGPGAADSVGPLGESYHSSIPILHITTEIERDWIGQERGVTHEAKAQLAMFASVADWRRLVTEPAQLPAAANDAFRHLATAHPRPAVLMVPTDVWAMTCDVEIGQPEPIERAAADEEAVERAVTLLRGAARPLILAGGGVMMADACGELRELAEALHAPVAVADGGKGAFPDDHPLALGSILGGRVWGDNPIHAYAAACDAALVVGTSLPFRSTAGVDLRLPENLIQVDVDHAMLGRNYGVGVGLTGDAIVVLRQLLTAMGEEEGSLGAKWSGTPSVTDEAEPLEDSIGELRRKAAESARAQFPNEARLWEGMRGVLGPDAIVFSDSTVIGYAASRCFPVLKPRTFHHPHGWVSIGYALAASLGAQVAMPNRQVVCVIGDGGLQYNMQELGTAVQYGLAPIVIVFNDNAWGVLKGYQQTRLAGRTFATDLVNPDFATLAKAYGVGYVRVSSQRALLDALDTVLASERLEMIEVALSSPVTQFT